MTITTTLKKLCNHLGKNNKSTYSVVAIAVANGIFRPTFTMLKKNADPESKKYAALREGLTEAVAIPTYLVCGELAAKCGEKIAKRASIKELQNMEKMGTVLSDKAKDVFISSRVKDSKASLMLIGVCTAAGLIIPALCSAVMNPIMSKFNKKSEPIKPVINKPVYNTKNTFRSKQYPVFDNRPFGMKVGGL